MTKVNDPIVINQKTVKNRITMAPTVKFDFAGADGMVTEKHIGHYRKRAEGGCGLICVEATAITPDGRFAKNHLGLWEDEQIEGHKKIVRVCHDNDVVTLIQLNHTGITSNPDCGPAIGPSEVLTRSGAPSRSMTTEEIHNMQENFVRAAVRALAAGYDGVQLHGCHSYLINQFVSPKTNLRTDEYGKDKALFGAQIISKIREKCGESFIISVRTPGAEPDVESAVKVAEEYIEAGCDYLQVSHGIDSFGVKLKNEADPYSDLCALGVEFHRYFGSRIPVSCVGGIMDPESVRYLIENDLTDTVDLARAELADPAFARAVLEGTPFVRCFECQRCQYGPGTKHMCPAAIKRNEKI